MGERAKCTMCGEVKLGMYMAWQPADISTRVTGHVCYGCEDTECTLIEVGRARIVWLQE